MPIRAAHPSECTPRASRPVAVLLACSLLVPGVLHAAKLGVEIDGVNEELQSAARAAAAISQYTERDVTAAQVRRLYDEAPQQIAKALEAYGYYSASVTGELNETAQGFQAVLHVVPGDPTTVAALELDVPKPAREHKAVAKAIAAFSPGKGQRFDNDAYEKSKAAIQATLIATGYLDAELTTHRVEVTRASGRAAIQLAWKPGVRYHYGATTLEGDQFAAGMLERYVPWHDGDFYSQGQLLELQQRLIDADYFGVVDVRPNLRQRKDGIVPITVMLAPAKRNVYTAGIFIDTDIGFGVKAAMRRRWVNARGHKFTTEALVAQRLKSLAATYTIPLPGPDQRSLNFGANYRDENTDTTQSRTESLVANETRQWLGFTRTLGLHLLTGDFTILDPNGNKDLNEKGSSTLLYPEAGLSRKRADDPLFVHKGYSLALSARASPGLLSDATFEQVRADAKWIRAIGERQRIILRGTVGVTHTSDFDKLPPELRFFGGGDRSIRGYGYQTIGPKNDNGLVIGGEDLAVASAEYEYYFLPNWGIATFVDTGDAFTGFSSYRNRIGAGLGLRWRSPVGMVRADIGVPINDPYGEHGVQLHLIIGPDL
jgi:translocation and assembly module TamA